jgi:D-alanyl-D-alanine carboxypeptidase (penicillin-binding protein 5/6)
VRAHSRGKLPFPPNPRPWFARAHKHFVLVAPLAAAFVVAALCGRAVPPHVDARAVLIADGATGHVLYAEHARTRLPIASLTKLMTVLVTLQHARPDDVVTVAPDATGIEGSTIGLRAGERLTVRELVEGALIQSANDAANALAYYVGHGSRDRFVAMMNRRAVALGLRDTHFVRPDGLDVPGHYSSARDMTRLARLAMRNPVVRSIVRRQTATIEGGRTLHTWNDLLSTFPAVIGVKTGHTSVAGWSEVAAARRPGGTLYATLIGGPSRDRRNADLAALLRFGLSRYRGVLLVDARRAYARAETEFGRGPVALVPSRPLVRVVLVGRPLVERVVARTRATLPVRRGQRLGEVRVYDGGRLLGTRPLVAARSVGRPGLGGRVSWYARRTVHELWSWVS